ncbi:MAG: GTPase Era [Pseudomonadales bacterium]|nr:GTPase Era [Pseudomonadales bacterium]
MNKDIDPVEQDADTANDGSAPTRCGFVAIVGRPNVGKSTLLNRILGQKISITSKKPQTTRHQIVGIHTDGPVQTVFVDTPGIHKEQEKAINRYMNRAASTAAKDVDVIVFLVSGTKWTEEDSMVLETVSKLKVPVILAVNKIDAVQNKGQLLPVLEKHATRMTFSDIIPISAQNGHNVEQLQALIANLLPESIHYYPEDQITDRTERFLAAELVREKVMRQLGAEVPYSVTVEIEEFKAEGNLLNVSALILVERDGQKKIVIGQKGEQLKIIGRDARLDMERIFDCKVMLNLWVKVKRGWADDERALRSLGYEDP